MNGLLLINKDKGMTSRSVDNKIMRHFKTRRVGHLGTLDPFAEGLLIIAINEGTKVLPYLENDTKTYIATFELGIETSTLDNTSEVIKKIDVPKLTKSEIEAVLVSFLGEIEQTPPQTSAIKVDGVPLYRYAHKGIKKEVPKRKVYIHKIRLLSYEAPFLEIEVMTGKGTYIRTLGKDIALKLGTIATTIKLVRTKNGQFKVEDAQKIDDIDNLRIIPIDKALGHLISIDVDETQKEDIRNGKVIMLSRLEPLLVATYERKVLAILERSSPQLYRVKRGFNL
ncbi:MAG: tRNA pseudouridine(55) synthase TruB [Erysipelotrichaceae bacterium]|nr:tRNA pseudouridine(55) synthase TruB [Bacillota bacterium]MDY0118392.1 tRNA pseudouridine(55) synthase TruB [Bacilli bacterium]NLJ32396.1 tRNA pseudouridine(55) synthase TruB [Erysipelotrichaceae bacterium]